jgi:D-aspartate ligase
MKENSAAPAVLVDMQSITGLQTARILSARNIPVIGIGSDPAEAFCRSRVYSRRIYSSTRDERLIDSLAQLGRASDTTMPLFLCADEAVRVVSRHREFLSEWYHIALPDHATVELLLDKTSFARFAQQNGLPIPRTVEIRDPADARRAAEEMRFPVLLKPAVRAESWAKFTSAKALKASTLPELLALTHRVLQWRGGLLAQEWIPGPESNLFSCNTYMSRSGEPLVSFVARKIRQWPPETGRSSLGVECQNDEVRDTAVRLFQLAEFYGPAYLEMKLDERDGRHWIIEPNIGRATGRSAIAEAGGVELLMTQYCDLLSLPLPVQREQRYAGAKWIYLRWDLQASAVGIVRGNLTLRQWWRSMRGPKTYAAWDRSDPVPFVLDLFAPLMRRLHRGASSVPRPEVGRTTEETHRSLTSTSENV